MARSRTVSQDVADQAKSVAVAADARVVRKAATAAGRAAAKTPAAPKPAPAPRSAVERSPERAKAVLERAARMRSHRASWMDQRLGDRQMRTPGALSKPLNLNALDPKGFEKMGRMSVPISQIVSDQPTISVKAAKGKIDQIAKGGTPSIRLLQRADGKFLMLDGNHGTTAHRALGHKAVEATVYKVKGAVKAASAAKSKAAAAVRKEAAKRAEIAKATAKGVAGGTGVLGKAVRGMAVANPVLMTAAGATAASGAYTTARKAGASKLQAAAAGATAASPMALAAAAPTVLGRISPLAVRVLAKVALPLTAAAAAVNAGVEGYKAYERGEGIGGIAGAAALGAADSLTFGLASMAVSRARGAPPAPPVPLPPVEQAAIGNEHFVAPAAQPKGYLNDAAAAKAAKPSITTSAGGGRPAVAPPRSDGMTAGYQRVDPRSGNVVDVKSYATPDRP